MQSILKANFKNILGDNWRGSEPSQKILTNLKQLPDECSYWTKPLTEILMSQPTKDPTA